MTGPTRPAHPDDDIATYAVGALPLDEELALERHLAGCTRCQRELAHHLATLAALTGEEVPPDHLWERITNQNAAAHRRPAPTHGTPRAPRTPRRSPRPASTGTRPSGPPRHPVDRRRRPTRVAAATLAAAAALTAVIGFGIHRLRTDGDEPPTSAELADAALHDPDATVVDLDDPDTDAPAARLVIDPTDHAYVLLDHLDDLTPDRTYQLWRTEGTTPISVALLGRGTPDVIPVTVPTGQARLAITAEPRRGSPAPTGPILAAGTLPS